jgi:hypothetical protein
VSSREDGMNGLRALARARDQGLPFVPASKRAETVVRSLAEERDALAALLEQSKPKGE